MDAIHVVAGGIGCAIGYALRTAGCPVVMIERNQLKLAAGRRAGIGVGHALAHVDFTDFDSWSPPADAIVVLCTKCYDNAPILERLPRSVRLIPVQNGFDPALEQWGHAVEGIASFVSQCPADLPLTQITRRGKLHIGPRVASTEVNKFLPSFIAALRKARVFRVVEVAAIEPYKYTKLMYNAAISPLAAAAGIDNGKLLSVPETRRLFFAFIQENHGILSSAGIALGKVGPFHPATVAAILKRRWVSRLMAWAFEPSLRGTYCSMAPDLPKGITEIDFYNQRLIEVACDHPCPLNRAAVKLIKRMEREHIAPSLDALTELTAALNSSAAIPSATARSLLRTP